MLKKITLLMGCIFWFITSAAQDLYIPRDVKQAYKNNTRSMTGEPGKKYWQNSAKYKIKLQMSPPNRTITGQEEIEYTNHSPDTLTVLNFKLILNNHKSGAARLGPAAADYITDGTRIDAYFENGVEKAWKDRNDGTNKIIRLTTPLLPNQKVNLTIHWTFDMSVQSGREGAIDKTTFFLAYFYPRVAVYDDYQGWDTMTFFGSQEFYNDFNDYELEVTVPKNYIVWSTGDLLNPTEVLQEPFAKKLAESMTSDEVINVASLEDLKNNSVTKQTDTNTWKWSAKNVPDVAIAVSDHYIWDAGSIEVDAKTKRRASVQAAYDEPSVDFKEMVNYGKHSLKWFSTNVPGIPYPYSKSTIVRGFADMEYPMMVNDNSQKDPNFTRFVVEHEIAHTYFPFYMGTNETRFGFMDEGWATALEYMIGTEDLGKTQADANFKMFRVSRWANNNSMELDMPIIIPSNVLSGPGMGTNEYGKAALGYLAMRDLLGETEFNRVLQGFMHNWQGKHPIPWDFFYSFNTLSGKNLNWFWKAWFFSHGYIDIGIEKVSINDGNTILKIKNIGEMPTPFDIIISDKKGKQTTYHQTPDVWENSHNEITINLKGVSDVSMIQLDGGIFMDADLSNNSWKQN